MLPLILFFISLAGLSIYSFSLIDPNLTLINASWWQEIQGAFINFGYLQRPTSTNMFLFLTLLLFMIYFFITRTKKIPHNPFHLALGVVCVTIVSYPFLSHDLFNYIFDAKIFTFYHQNPYLHAPNEFMADPWIRFMHWIHRTYPYGPAYLVLSFIPSFLSMHVFILNFFSFKLMNAMFYLLGVWSLQKLDKRSALIFALHPFVIVEGLINAHNDLIAVALAIVGMYLLQKKNGSRIKAFFVLLGSGLIKFISLPFLGFMYKERRTKYFVLIVQVAIVLYLVSANALLAWYFLIFFAFLPVFPHSIEDLDFLFLGLLLSNYPLIRYGTWEKVGGVDFKNTIIFIFAAINVVYVLYKKRMNKKSRKNLQVTTNNEKQKVKNV